MHTDNDCLLRPALLDALASHLSPANVEVSPYLNRGSSLDAIVLFEAGLKSGDRNYIESANEKLASAMLQMESLPLSTSLYRGVTGVGWILKAYADLVADDHANEFIEDLDCHLIDGLSESRNIGIDIVDGLAGLIIYATQNSNLESQVSIVLKERLIATSAECLNRYLGDVLEKNAASSYHNLGFAHGIPGLLACITALKGSPGFESIEDRLSSAAEKLWLERIESNVGFDFPSASGMESPARMAWCYGLPGIALLYSEISKINSKFNEYLMALLRSFQPKLESVGHGLVDASLCHGSAGLSLISNYLFAGQPVSCNFIEGVEIAARAAVHWDDGGAPYCTPLIGGKCIRFNSFLEGTAGTVLALECDENSQRRWARLLGIYL